jgi:nucleoid-associated protein YgaU
MRALKGGPMADLKFDSDNEMRRRYLTAVLDAPSETNRDGETEWDETDRMYLVAEGDTLSAIAKKFYGQANSRWRILDANRDVIDDPYYVEPGSMLRIPK